MRLSFTIYIRLAVIGTLIFIAFWCSHYIDNRHNQAQLVGLYGLAPIDINCPRDGQFSIKPSLGNLVQSNEVLMTFQSEGLSLLKRRFKKEMLRNTNAIKTRLIKDKLLLQDQTLQAQSLLKAKSAQLWADRGERLKLEAQISALAQGIKGLKKAVKRGRAPLKDLVQIQADLKSAKVQIKPKKNQEFAMQTLVQELEVVQSLRRGDAVKTETYLNEQDLLTAHQNEIKAWQEDLEDLNKKIESLETIRAPITGIIIKQRSDVDYKQAQRCLAGETMLTIQPTQASIRLWQIDRLDQQVQPGEQIELRIESELLLDSPTLQIEIKLVDQGLTLLPDSLQTQASQAAAQFAWFGDLPKVYGIRIEADIKPLNNLTNNESGDLGIIRNKIPWGLSFQTTGIGKK